MAPIGAGGARDLAHLHASGLQEPRDAGAVAAGALDARARDQPERARPAQQLLIAVRSRRNADRSQQPPDRVKRRGRVLVEVRVDTERDLRLVV